jgi:hypothetical protein
VVPLGPIVVATAFLTRGWSISSTGMQFLAIICGMIRPHFLAFLWLRETILIVRVIARG